MAATQLLRPGFLVMLRTSLQGGVTYERQEIQADHKEGDARVAEWNTRREIEDAAEHERAKEACSAARSMIVRQCRQTSRFGLMCAIEKEDELREAIDEAQRIVNAHNASARITRVELTAIIGRVAQSDEQAAQQIGAEVRALIDRMERGVKAADPEAIRAAANEARMLAGALTDEAAAKVSAAIKEVRSIATAIVKRVEKAGERAADVLADVQTTRLEAARFAVLDILGENEEPEPVEALPVAGRAVEFDPDDTPASAPAAPQITIEF